MNKATAITPAQITLVKETWVKVVPISETAWTNAYQLLAGTMIEGAAQASRTVA